MSDFKCIFAALSIVVTMVFANLSFAGSAGKEIKDSGVIFCEKEQHATSADCDLRFTRFSDGLSYEIIDSPDLLKAHLESGKNLKVDLNGKIMLSSIFHTTHVKVSKFTVLGEYKGAVKLTESSTLRFLREPRAGRP
jgi:hypothetical protein